MKQRSFLAPILLPEYLVASIILHGILVLLLCLAYQHYQAAQQNKHRDQQQPQQPKIPQQPNQPKVRVRRTPAVPNPVIGKEQESQGPALPQAAVPAAAPQSQEKPAEKPPTPAPREQVKKENPAPEPTPNEHTQQQEQKPEPQARHQQRAGKRHSSNKTTEHVTAPPKRAQHTWHAEKKCTPARKQETTCGTALSVMDDYSSNYFASHYEGPQKSMTPAEKVAERFNKEFREAAVNDYITAVHHAIVFSLNRMRIMLAQDEIPALIVMNLNIDSNGNLRDVKVTIPRDAQHDNDRTPHNLAQLIEQGITRAAPFRPFPASIKKPTIDVNINAYPDFDTFGRTGNARTPLVFSIIGSRR